MNFADDLNAAMGMVDSIPRVEFAPGMSADAYNWLAKKHANGGVHEPATLAAFLAVKQRFTCKTIFDAGAHFGYLTLAAKNIFKGADIVAFDMHPAVIGPLRINVGRSVTCALAVLSDEIRPRVRVWVSGFNVFEAPEGGWAESRAEVDKQLEAMPGALKQRGADNRGRGWTDVDFVTLDAACEMLKEKPTYIKPPDLIKIDVEGFQAKAVLGGLETFKKHKPVIVIELHDPDKLARFGTTNAKTVQPLFDLGYQGFWCGDFRSKDARFEPVHAMSERHERLSLMVLTP